MPGPRLLTRVALAVLVAGVGLPTAVAGLKRVPWDPFQKAETVVRVSGGDAP